MNARTGSAPYDCAGRLGTSEMTKSQAKEPEASGGLCAVAPHAVRVGEASADLPATSEHMDVTAGETAPSLSRVQPNTGDPVAWRIYCTNNGATGYLYTECLPFDPGPGVHVRRDPEPLYAARAEQDAKRIEELEAALRPFAKFADRFGPTGREDGWQITNNPSGNGNLTMGDCRNARRALQPKARHD